MDFRDPQHPGPVEAAERVKLAPKLAVHASESGHWYDRNGNQVLEVPSANGKKLVKCTLAHARKLDLAPGVTTIIRCAAAPQLTNWMVKQGVLAAATLPRLAGETDDEWIERAIEDSREQAAKAAEEGTRIHAAIQAHFQGEGFDLQYRPHIEAVLDVLPKGDAWRTEIGVAHHLGYGTKIDLHDDQHLLDFKGKDGDQEKLDAERTYDEHAMQLAAGMRALGSAPRRCGIVFVSRTHPGACSVRWIDEDELERAWGMFQSLLAYWQVKNRHRPWRTAA